VAYLERALRLSSLSSSSGSLLDCVGVAALDVIEPVAAPLAEGAFL
jgi:hypothetical protein